MPPSRVVCGRGAVGRNYRGQCAWRGDSRFPGGDQLNRAAQFIHDFEDAHAPPWVNRRLAKLLPSLDWDGLGGLEKRGRFIEFKDVARLEAEAVADMNGNGDLTFGRKGSLQE